MPELEEVLDVLRGRGFTVVARMPAATFEGFVGPAEGSVVIPYMVELTIAREVVDDGEASDEVA